MFKFTSLPVVLNLLDGHQHITRRTEAGQDNLIDNLKYSDHSLSSKRVVVYTTVPSDNKSHSSCQLCVALDPFIESVVEYLPSSCGGQVFPEIYYVDCNDEAALCEDYGLVLGHMYSIDANPTAMPLLMTGTAADYWITDHRLDQLYSIEARSGRSRPTANLKRKISKFLTAGYNCQNDSDFDVENSISMNDTTKTIISVIWFSFWTSIILYRWYHLGSESTSDIRVGWLNAQKFSVYLGRLYLFSFALLYLIGFSGFMWSCIIHWQWFAVNPNQPYIGRVLLKRPSSQYAIEPFLICPLLIIGAIGLIRQPLTFVLSFTVVTMMMYYKMGDLFYPFDLVKVWRSSKLAHVPQVVRRLLNEMTRDLL
eukprot:GHVH01007334.1.p1 GENE.GHVH01007334.1~~GHVH01007334.1.p1  ORF type:complete len:367 (-),score=28.48 GHVH01007334.1:553-1653(-)